MKLATTTGDFHSYTHDQAECLRHIREAGFRYADYSFGPDYSHRIGVYAEDYKAYFEKINLAAKELGITLVQAHAPMGAPLADDGGNFMADTIRCIEACAAWGIPNLVVHSGYTRGLDIEQTMEENKKFFSALLTEAEKYGVNILVENFNRMQFDDIFWIDNATYTRQMIEHVNHPLFHAVWDTGHANLQEMPQDEELLLLGDHVRALHVHDNMGDWDAHMLPFLGTMNMDAVMNGLAKIGYNGYFTFEVGGIYTRPNQKRPYEADTRLAKAPLELKKAAERYLYELGKVVLESYGCFEE